MIDCLKCAEMHKMFDGKFVVVAKVQPIAKTHTITTNVNVVDVNVDTSKVTEKHVFKDKALRKTKSVID